MTAMPPPEVALLAELASLASCDRAEGFACITARREHGASSVEIPQPQFVILLEGSKQVRTAHQSLTAHAGDMLLFTQRCRIDVVNTPDAGSGRYLSAIVPLWSEALPAAGDAIAQPRLIDHGPVLRRWRQALQDGHYSEARLALAELVLAWCRQGHGNLLLPQAPSLGEQIRDRIAADPSRDWQSRDVEDQFALSGATLRRRLAAERTSLRQLLTEARLAHGMTLLYTTDLPLKTVAARAGYRSAASFSKRFAEQYGLAPTDI
ncbi:AraC family transcriptional regulator [Stenotrophomonas sp.]|uniref:helix-turn-helix transcriptional regulator n=1 Tax=Stenotrophomonas sp. TaxID=69392 RepID=UPI002D513303|nr:AraC family transcriptional regulator [Stenotrophomonas sp.]HYQ24958.1 AraC family transcriptional regulator [Stenotrophomonas sp.]